VELKINPNTIAKAYGELEIRGILATQVGSGTYISDKKPVLEDDGRNRKIREVLGRFIQDMRDLGVEEGDLADLIKDYRNMNKGTFPGEPEYIKEEFNESYQDE
jgi:GntR family transcriptional regulator